jgi:hypothetical protein
VPGEAAAGEVEPRNPALAVARHPVPLARHHRRASSAAAAAKTRARF